MIKTASADVVIFGGGVAGLWLLNRLRQSGMSAFLFESHTLGGGQTNKSQGIIHGGTKYALQGHLTSDMLAMTEMPALWHDCLQGRGELNLSAVPILSAKQYLWSETKFGSKLTKFFASAALSSTVESLDRQTYPTIFQHMQFKGEVFALNEMVIDVPALVRELVKANQDAVFKIELLTQDGLHFDEQGHLISATIYAAGQAVSVSAQHFVFTAGAGNEMITRKLNQPGLAMQRRPLHMVLVKMPGLSALYAHCLGIGSRPRITITTHYMQDGSTVWYLGGLLAEDGVHRSSDAQIIAAQKELKQLFPWVDFSDADFATFMIDRAEPSQKNGFKPENAFVKTIQNITVAWPTKLVLAPNLAREVMYELSQRNIAPQGLDARELRAWPMPPIASPIWEELFCKSVA